MSLTYDDIQQIKTVVNDAVEPLRGDILALTNDVKDIYAMLKPANEELGNKIKDHEVRITTLESQAA
jgi:hypothetical protein